MATSRMRAIYDAATMLFLRQGYSKTQMSHIAKAIGVSVGTLYHDFNGKQEIMHFVLKCTIDPDFMERDFERPVLDDIFIGLEDEIISTLEANKAEFANNLQHLETYRFETLISDAFDMLARYAVGCLFIEKNQYDVVRLADYYRDYRKQFFDTMTKYLSGYIEKGIMRPVKHIELVTTMIIEVLTWWAMDMRYIAFETRDIPLELAKETCLENIVAAYKN